MDVRSLVLSSLLMTMPGDVWIASLEIIHTFPITSPWLRSKAVWSACLIGYVPQEVYCCAELKFAPRPSLHTAFYTGVIIWAIASQSIDFADIALLVHNYSWRWQFVFSWFIFISIWEIGTSERLLPYGATMSVEGRICSCNYTSIDTQLT